MTLKFRTYGSSEGKLYFVSPKGSIEKFSKRLDSSVILVFAGDRLVSKNWVYENLKHVRHGVYVYK